MRSGLYFEASTEAFYCIALSQIPNVGPINARNLIAYCGSAEEVFKTPEWKLMSIPNIGVITAKNIASHAKVAIERAEQEIQFSERNQVRIHSFNDASYPQRLKHCLDAPLVLFTKGNFDWNTSKVVGMVGTRMATDYGKQQCEALVEGLSSYGVLVVSGLAYGIDIAAQKAALKHQLPTLGVVAHGLDSLYPSAHYSTAQRMLEHGGLVTEYLSGSPADRENFPQRNRIIAGLSDALVVVESSDKGGSLITVEYANNYNRDVFAIPGRLNDPYSQGCNALIKNNKAALLTSAQDLISNMNWDANLISSAKKGATPLLFPNLNEEEQNLYDLLQKQGVQHIDQLCTSLNMTQGKVANLLLNMEFNGLIRTLPGKQYQSI